MDWHSDVGRRLRARLEREHLVWLTTVGAKGTPFPSLVWFLWEPDRDEMLIYSRPDRLKLDNIEARPRVALNFNSDDGGGSVGVMAGTARLDPDTPPPHEHPVYLAKYEDMIRGRLGMVPEQFGTLYSVPIRVVIDAGRAW